MQISKEGLQISIGDVVRSDREHDTWVVTQLFPVCGMELINPDRKGERLNPWRSGTLTGRLAVLGSWDTDKVYQAILAGHEGDAILDKEGFPEELLRRLQADELNGPVYYPSS